MPVPDASDPPVSRIRLLGHAMADVGPWLAGFFRLVRSSRANAKKVKEFRARAKHLPPPGLSAYRDFTLAPFGDRRVCATASLPLDDFRAVRRAFDVTINGVVHAVVAGALRRELLARGEDTGAPHIASFAISADKDQTRLWGNRVTPTFVSLYNDIEDPVERLRRTAASCREGVELRQVTGLDMAGNWIDYAARLAIFLNRVLAFRTNMTNHVCTADVAGPPTTRWLGPVEVVDWYSFAVVVPAISSNIVFYSYAGKMNIGLLVAPEDFPQPYRFLDEIRDSLQRAAAAGPRGAFPVVHRRPRLAALRRRKPPTHHGTAGPEESPGLPAVPSCAGLKSGRPGGATMKAPRWCGVADEGPSALSGAVGAGGHWWRVEGARD